MRYKVRFNLFSAWLFTWENEKVRVSEMGICPKNWQMYGGGKKMCKSECYWNGKLGKNERNLWSLGCVIWVV